MITYMQLRLSNKKIGFTIHPIKSSFVPSQENFFRFRNSHTTYDNNTYE